LNRTTAFSSRVWASPVFDSHLYSILHRELRKSVVRIINGGLRRQNTSCGIDELNRAGKMSFDVEKTVKTRRYRKKLYTLMRVAKWRKTAVERADRIGCGPRQGPVPLAWCHVHLPAHPRSVPAQYQTLTVTDLPNMPSLSDRLLTDAAPFSQLYWPGHATKPQRDSMSRQITPQRCDLCITYVRATTTATYDTLAG
jgi:hypothetical protein